jgi:hypothetical protein
MDGYGSPYEKTQRHKDTEAPRRTNVLSVRPGASVSLCLCVYSDQQAIPITQLAHFHHVHINAIDPEASIRFYTSHFNSERVKLGGTIDAVWAQKSWLLYIHEVLGASY